MKRTRFKPSTKPLKRGKRLQSRTPMKRSAIARAVDSVLGLACSAGHTLVRGSQLKRTRGPKKQTVEQAEKQRHWNLITANKVAAGHGCENCKTRGWLGNPLIGHHRHKKSQGGPWTTANHVLLCELCHTWVHDDELQAESLGWLIRPRRQIQPVADAAPSQRRAS